MKTEIKFRVNGVDAVLKVYPMARLLDVLREDLGLTGTKEGCGEGECGACSIKLDGKLVNSCLVPALQAQGTDILTIEGVATQGLPPGQVAAPLPSKLPETLSTLQSAFLHCGGSQCGICTPGMVMAAQSLLEETADPTQITEAHVRVALAGNLCRCTGYMKIFESVLKACQNTHGATL